MTQTHRPAGPGAATNTRITGGGLALAALLLAGLNVVGRGSWFFFADVLVVSTGLGSQDPRVVRGVCSLLIAVLSIVLALLAQNRSDFSGWERSAGGAALVLGSVSAVISLGLIVLGLM